MDLTTPALLFPAISLLLLAYTNRFLVLAQLIRQLKQMDSEDDYALIARQIGMRKKRIVLTKRMQEEAPDGSRAGIARAAAATGGVITAAGVIFAASMFALMAGSVDSLVQTGFVIGAGLLIDTFVVRTMLVPAIASIGMFISSSCLSTPICASPRAPPPDSTRPVRSGSARVQVERKSNSNGSRRLSMTRVRAAGGVCLDVIDGHGVPVHVGADVMHLRHPGEYLDPDSLGQEAPGDRTGGDASDRLAGAGTSASTPVPVPVLGLVGEVGVRGSVEVAEVVVCAGPGIGVSYQDGDGAAGCEALEDAGQDLDRVGLAALGDEARRPGAALVEKGLDIAADICIYTNHNRTLEVLSKND